jgi:hypothetical protein
MSLKTTRTQLSEILDEGQCLPLQPLAHFSGGQGEQSSSEELVEGFADGSKSFEERKQYRDEMCRRDRDMGREAITNICRSYEFSASKDLLAFICFLFDSGTLDLFEKIECVRTLQEIKHPSVKNYLLAILQEFQNKSVSERPSISLYIDILRFLLDDKLDDQVVDSIKWLCRETPAAFLYRTIVSIHRESTSPDNSEQISPRRISKEYLHCLYELFFYSVSDDKHKILASQYLLINKVDETFVESEILIIAKDSSRPHQIRADAADTLVKLASASGRTQALGILKELGRDLTQAPSIGSNRENVHLFDDSVNEFLLKLGAIKLSTIQKNGSEQVRSFDDIVDIIHLMPQYQESDATQDAINSSLLRIRIDQVLYPGSQTLSTIFLRIFQTIEKHENKDLLLQRLLEELIDMAATCSSGHASRLVNVFSGIDGFILRVSWKEQIASNVAGRLTALAKVAKDEETRKKYLENDISLSDEQLEKIDSEFREKILCEMANTGIENRINWSRFSRTIMSSLIEDLKKEFVESGHLSMDDFVQYFREAMVFYETGIRE